MIRVMDSPMSHAIELNEEAIWVKPLFM